MSETTKISWANKTWNGWRGCHAVSPGCDRCYAEAAHKRAGWDFSNIVKTKTWNDPPRWQREAEKAGKTELVFTCSWSDFFLPEADQWRPEAWSIIKRCPNLIFQILTKRPGLIEKRLPADWDAGYPNCWLGVSVESRPWLWRMDTLRRIPAAVRFVSTEPLLEDIMPEFDAHLDGFHWVIVGGESGNRSNNFRPMDHQWARNIRDLCRRRGIAMFFKQSSGFTTETGVKLDGELVREYPRGHGAPSGEVG